MHERPAPVLQSSSARLFLISFLVLFLEVALIRWMPAYVRLLAYFSNFILLASFLGIGVGCLLAPVRAQLFRWFPLVLAGVVGVVAWARLDIAIPQTSTSIYFSSGTAEEVVAVESTWFLPVLFGAVAVLFVLLSQRLGREMAAQPAPLRAYLWNLAGSLLGVAGFGLMSAFQLPPTVWFAIAAAAAVPFLLEERRLIAAVNIALLVVSLGVVHRLAADTLWSPYYKITTYAEADETVVEVNNIFHQSMAPVEEKEYFYQWPYTVFGDTFDDVLILGAGSGTDVAAALLHGASRVDAVEIDPVIVRLGRRLHPNRPYDDPRVSVVTDDARHFLRTTDKQYDLVVFALIDSLTLQSSFSAVRLESFMFTEEAFRAVQARLKPGGVLVIYNYFRERWLVDRLANTAARVFGEPRVHTHEEHGHLGVMVAGPGLSRVADWPAPPDRVAAFNHPEVVSPGRLLDRDPAVEPATDDWPFLYMRTPHLPAHYGWALLGVLVVSAVTIAGTLAGVGAAAGGLPSLGRFLLFFLLGAGFMILETKGITQFALIWGSTWVVASFTIGAVLLMAVLSAVVAQRVTVIRPWVAAVPLFLLLGLAYLLPIGSVSFPTLTAETIFYSVLTFSPIFFAGLLFSGSLKQTGDVAFAYGANLLGSMLGGLTEYMALVTGYQALLLVVAACYLGAVVLYPSQRR